LDLFTTDFSDALQSLVTRHHEVYPRLPPRDIFFEDLVARSFRNIGISDIILSTPGRSKEDMIVSGVKLSVKTETGYGTNPNSISITKLSTTETTTWQSAPLVDRILHHLSQYEEMLMLRAVWLYPPAFKYQLLSIPPSFLALINTAKFNDVGKREGRRSIGGDVFIEDKLAFHVHFDGSDGKCSIRNLAVNQCCLLKEWTHEVPSEWSDNWPIHTSKTSGKRSKKRVADVHDGPLSISDQQLDLYES
jgi:hypothetical protein